MWDQINLWLAGGGLVLGMAFGVIAQRSRFCVVAAVSNLALMRDYRQLHAYLAALGAAVVGTFALEWSELVPIADTGYRRPSLDLIGTVGGGVLFGFGAMLAGGCASRTLVRTAEGNLGALLTLLAFAISSSATMFGALEPVHGWVLARALPIGAGDASLTAVLQLPQWLIPLGIGIACLAVILALGRWQDHIPVVAAGLSIGLLVVAGWWVTGALGRDDFDPSPPASLTMAAPLARNLAWLSMGQSTGTEFALLLVPGVLLGALCAAMVSGELRWVAPASERVGAYLGGGALMGVGALMAGGCNIGQGLSGAATLSASSFLAVAGILGGMLLGTLWVTRSAS